MAFRDLDFFVTALQALPNLDELALFSLDLTFSLLVGFLLTLQPTQVLLVLILLALQPALRITVLDARFVDELVTAATVFNGVLPLQVQLVSLLMQPFEFFRCLVQFNLRGLSLRDLLFEFSGFAGDFDGELLNLKRELLDLGLISSAELLKGQVIFLLLAGGKSPLL